MSRRLLPPALVLALQACASASGAGPRALIVTDRPDFTESAATVPAGMMQAEGGYTYARAGSVRDQSVGEVLARNATGARTELRLGLNSYSITSAPGARAAGLEDASVGGKVRLLDGAEGFAPTRPDVSLIVATSVPTGSHAYGENAWQPEAKLVVGYQLTERLAWTSNFNYAAASEGGRRFGQGAASTSLGFGATDRVGSYLEYFVIAPETRGGDASHVLNGGLTLLLTDDFQLDARLGRAIGAPDAGHFVGVGISRRW